MSSRRDEGPPSAAAGDLQADSSSATERASGARLIAGGMAGVSAWVSFGTLALDASGGRIAGIGLLPGLEWLVLMIGAGVLLAWRFTRPSTPLLLLSGVALLPWTGWLQPPALIWHRATTSFIWLACAADVLRGRRRPPASNPIVVPALAVALCLTYGVAIDPLRLTGDQPRYLLVTQSLLLDGDVEVGNDYDEQRYLGFYGGSLEPRLVVVSPDGRQYSLHGLGISALVLPAFAAGGVIGVRLMLALLSAAGLLVLWHACRLVGKSDGAAWAGVGSVAVSVPFAAHAAAVYPDGVAAVVVSIALWVLLRFETQSAASPRALIVAGSALAVLPWLHLRLSIVAMAFGSGFVAAILQRGRWRMAAQFLAVPTLSAVAWVASARWMFGSFDPRAPFQNHLAGDFTQMPIGILGLIADHEYGLLPYAPALLFGVVGLLRAWPVAPIATAAGAAALVGTLLTSASYAWWGGTSAAARFLVAVVPVLGWGVSAWWATVEPRWREICVGLVLLAGAVLGFGLVDQRGVFLTGSPDARETVFERAQTLVDLPAALPSLFRQGTTPLREGATACLWALVGAVLALGFRHLPVRLDTRQEAAAAIVLVVFWIAISASLVWQIPGREALTPDRSQLALLGASGSRAHRIGFVTTRGLAARGEVIARIAFAAPGSDRNVLLHVPNLPAGRYRIHVEASGDAPDASLAAELGRRAWPAWIWNARAPGDAPTFSTAVPVHSLAVRASSGQIPEGIRVTLAALEIGDPDAPAEAAQRVTRYGERLVYAFDEASFMETGGFWIGGDRTARMLFADADGRSTSATLRLEAGPSPIHVSVSGDSFRHAVALDASGTTTVAIPRPSRPEIVSVSISGGFPAAGAFNQPGDRRWLGVWVTLDD